MTQLMGLLKTVRNLHTKKLFKCFKRRCETIILRSFWVYQKEKGVFNDMR